MSDWSHAGGVVVRRVDGEAQYLIVRARQDPSHWVLPKGHVESGESVEGAAVREVLEETGVRGVVVASLGTSEYEMPHERVRVRYFLMRAEREGAAEEDREHRWCSYDEAKRLLSFGDAREILERAHQEAPSKTTEIFVELLFAGLLVIGIAILPFLDGEVLTEEWLDPASGTGVVVVAYLLGIVVDRLADTVLDRIDGIHQFAFSDDAKDRAGLTLSELSPDVFPEAKLMNAVRMQGGGVLEWVNYLRSRIRITRTLTVLLPGLTISAEVAVGKLDGVDRSWILAVAWTVYLGTFIFSERESQDIPHTSAATAEITNGLRRWKELPSWGAVILGILGVIVVGVVGFGLRAGRPEALALPASVALVGGLLSAAAARAWWRVSKTMRRSLREVHALALVLGDPDQQPDWVHAVPRSGGAA